jgi:hypothetical protein
MTYVLFKYTYRLESNYNMNLNDIPLAPPLPPSLINKKRKTSNDHQDMRQSRIKNAVIAELKSFFASRNQNNREKYKNTDSEIRTPFQSPKKQIIQQKNDFEVPTIDRGNQ